MKKTKHTYSEIFDDMKLLYGLVKRMNGYAFCFTGDQELVRLGFMIKTNPKIKPYITAKGKKFMMDVIKNIAGDIPEDEPEVKVKENKPKPLSVKERQEFQQLIDDEDEDEDEEEMEEFKKKVLGVADDTRTEN